MSDHHAGTHVPVESSNLASVSYHEPSRTMQVRFKGGATYEHSGVEPLTHAALMGAESAGKFYGANLKGRLGCRRVSG